MNNFNLKDIIKENVGTLLNEGRLEDIKAKYNEDQWNMVNHLSQNDPSGNNKYLAWMAKMILNISDSYWERRRWNVDDRSTFYENLAIFHNNIHKFEKKDINQYTSVKEFDDAVEVSKTKLSRKQMKSEGAVKVYEDEDFALIQPRTHEASCKYGSRTKWCVTMRGHSGYFESYSTHGPLFFLIDKRRNEPTNSLRTQDYYKIALHYQPRFRNGGSLHNKAHAAQYAKNMEEGEFVASANKSVAQLDFWNVMDKKVSVGTVLKYLGGPGRGQKARGTAILDTLNGVMETYTKKALSDFYGTLGDVVDNSQKINDLEEKWEIQSDKYNHYDYIFDYLDGIVDNIENLIEQMDDKDVEIEDDLIGYDDFVTRLSHVEEKRDIARDRMNYFSAKKDEIQSEIDSLKKDGENTFSFYDMEKSKPV